MNKQTKRKDLKCLEVLLKTISFDPELQPAVEAVAEELERQIRELMTLPKGN